MTDAAIHRRHHRLVALLAASTLGGCMGERQAVVSLPGPLLGTWIEVAGAGRDRSVVADGDRGGFLAIAPDQVVLNLTNTPRGVCKPVDGALAAGSGRLGLDNGLRLYLAGGRGEHSTSVAGTTVAVPCDWLDVDVYQVDGSSERLLGRTRLWSQAGLQIAAQYALAERLASTRAPAAPAAPAAVAGTAAPAHPADRDFLAGLAGHDPTLTLVAADLVRQVEQGVAPAVIGTSVDTAAQSWRAGILRLLEAARRDRSGDAQALLAEAERRHRQLASFRVAVTRWREARG